MTDPRAETPSLEELTQRWADALTAEREGYWRAADVAAYVLRAATTRAEGGRLVGHLASIGHCSSGYVRALAALSAAYGTESRYPDVSQALLRACLAAGRRLGRRPAEILEEALLSGWHAAQVGQLGKPPRTELTAAGTCDGCGAWVQVRMAAEPHRALRGLSIPCPVCVRTAWDDARDPRDVLTVGVLG